MFTIRSLFVLSREPLADSRAGAETEGSVIVMSLPKRPRIQAYAKHGTSYVRPLESLGGRFDAYRVALGPTCSQGVPR